MDHLPPQRGGPQLITWWVELVGLRSTRLLPRRQRDDDLVGRQRRAVRGRVRTARDVVLERNIAAAATVATTTGNLPRRRCRRRNQQHETQDDDGGGGGAVGAGCGAHVGWFWGEVYA